MKKILLTLTMVLCLATGCGNTTTVEETANVETEMAEEIQVEEDAEEIELNRIYTEEYVEQLKEESIADLEANWEEEGIPNEECKDEMIELIKSIEYDDSFEYGYDLDSLERAYVNILVKYDLLPQECAGHNFDELEAVESIGDL